MAAVFAAGCVDKIARLSDGMVVAMAMIRSTNGRYEGRCAKSYGV